VNWKVIGRTLAYDLHHVAQSLNRESLFVAEIFMPEEPTIVQHPSGFLWGAAVRSAARHRFKFSIQCENSFKQRINSGLEAFKVGLLEFTERKSEAQGNVEKLVSAMVRAQLEKDPAIDVLDEWTIPYALHDAKLCPGLWPIC